MRTRVLTHRFCARSTRFVLGCWILAVGCFTLLAHYAIDWHSMDSGSGTSTGGVCSVSGTVGQPDAGPTLNGGSYAVVGGFWSLLAAVQTTGAPMLSITFTATNSIVVSWPSPSTDFGLQQNNDLNTTNWVGTTETPSDNGTSKFIIVSPPTGNRFYRLVKP